MTPEPQRILVVEDHAPFRRLICAMLRERPEFQTIEAADGLQAVQRAEELLPDLILLDINLPGMSGFEAAKQIRRLAPRARLLFLSQESSQDVVRVALGLGAHGYIHKMSAATDLLPAIDAVLAGERFVSRSLAFTESADAPDPRRHEMLFCSNDAALVDAFTLFIAGALSAGDAAIALVTESHRVELLEELRTQGVDIDGALERGTCCFFDADVAPDPVLCREAIERVRAAAARAGKGHPRIAFCGERAGRLWAAGRTNEAVQLERFGGELPHDVHILCAYPVQCPNDDHTLTHICTLHTAVSAASVRL